MKYCCCCLTDNCYHPVEKIIRIVMNHLESAKCIRGLSATPLRIPPKLYHLILPYPFKPPQIISRKTPRGRSMTHNVAGTSAKDTESSICNAWRGGRNLSETRRILGWRPRDLRMSFVNFHPRNALPSYRFIALYARRSLAFPRRKTCFSLSW